MKSHFLYAFFIIAVACKHDPHPGPPVINGGQNPIVGSDDCDPDSVYFENDIYPFFVSNCAQSGCHDATGQDGVYLDSYAGILNQSNTSNPNNSDIVEVLKETDPDKRMPPAPAAPISQEQINMIITWMSQGAQNNGCDGCDTANVTFASTVFPVFESYCKSCHGLNNPYSVRTLISHADIVSAVNETNLLDRIHRLPSASAMPPGGPITDCDIRKIELWIANGMLNN